jgi:[NiFe] hydrogenase assembly HybE family chaperone
MNDAASPALALQEAFHAIHDERMRGLPFVNEALQVEAVGFREWEGRWLGILITPWFMNLVLMPHRAGQWAAVKVGDAWRYRFPAGAFEFVGGHDPAVGEFQACSLFSPVFEFDDQDTARLTAIAALDALFDPAHREPAPYEPSPAAPAEPPQPTPMSKRDFLGVALGREPRR